MALTTTVNLIFGSAVLDPMTGVILNDEASQLLREMGTMLTMYATDGRLFYPWHAQCLWFIPIPLYVDVWIIILHQEVTFCTTDNYPEPGKRPLSSTTPTIMENADGSLYLAIGGSGGSRIFPTVFQVLLNLDWGMDVSAAIEHGRVHDQLFPTMVDADDVLPADLLDGLRDKGHNITGERSRDPDGPLGRLTRQEVSDTGRVAAVIQAVIKLNDTIYGEYRLYSFACCEFIRC